MKDRIIQFLSAEKITPAEFADKIGVQRSSMSHILNGRNYPSASFLQKMFQVYPAVNPRWLMIGEGTMNMESASAAVSSAAVSSAAVSSAAATDIVPGLITEEPVSEIRTVLFHGQEAENPLPSVPGVQNVPLMAVPKDDAPDSAGSPPSESVLNQSFPSSGGSEGREKVSPQPHLKSPETTDPSNGNEIEQVLFFYKDKTFRIYRPS